MTQRSPLTDKKPVEASWGTFASEIEAAIAHFSNSSAIPSIWQKDPAAWKANPSDQKEITNRLGWLDAPQKADAFLAEIISFASEIREAGLKHVVVMGMGGSSLAPEVFLNVFGPASGFPKLIVLDSTDPERVKDVRGAIDIKKTLFIFASKSGTTTEPFSFYKFFRAETDKALGKESGSRFIAITDPGTSLATLAKESGFRKIFIADPDVGGRFSALTHFGLVPAALIGVDVKKLIDRARKTAERCRLSDATKNKALRFGVAMAVLAKKGRDKLTITASKKLEPFGDWAEQLIAESTGKEGVGIVPIVREPLGAPAEYGEDRFFVSMSVGDSESSMTRRLDALAAAGHPVFSLRLDDVYDLGGEFFLWEMAVAIAGATLGINPFDQPDVQSAKDKTKALLKEIETSGKISFEAKGLKEAGFWIACGTTLGASGQFGWDAFWSSVRPGDGIHLLAFLPDRDAIKDRLAVLRAALRKATRCAVSSSLGPRYLHSTGQLHKGGADNGLYLILTARRTGKLPVPGDKFSFEELERAQAVGDFQALNSKKRRVLFVELPDFSDGSLTALQKTVLSSLPSHSQGNSEGRDKK